MSNCDEFCHVPVLLNESVGLLAVKPGGVYIDATVGGGSHSRLIAERLAGSGRLICIDRDAEAVKKAKETLADFCNATVLRGNFRDTKEMLAEIGVLAADGVLADIGVSSRQLDTPGRGFSYMHDSRIDMRMDTNQELSAYDIVNGASMDELSEIIRTLGEERWAARIAAFIVERRAIKPIETTFELVSAIKAAIPKKVRQDGHHPAKKTFQALRYSVNEEIRILDPSIRDFVDILRPDGRVCVIGFNSLEDRIIKQTFRDLESPCVCIKDAPICVCGKRPTVRVVTRKPVLPSEEELLANPRARSAKLRAAEKI